MSGDSKDVSTQEFWTQLEFFSGVRSLRDRGMERYSNLTEVYSQLPKRVYHKKGQEGIVYREFNNGDAAIGVSITPAMIPIEKTVKGVQIRSQETRYPALREDRVEEALAYIAAQGGARIKPDNLVIGVFFSLQQIKTTLKNVFGVTYSVAQIREGLLVLSRSVLELKFESAEFKTTSDSTRISKLTLVNRKEFIQDRDARCYCELHWAFARDIAAGNYCLHDVEWQAKLETDLAQDLMKRLSVKYRHANNSNFYSFMGKQALINTSLGFYEKNPNRSWAQLFAALDDLQTHGVISGWRKEARYDDKKGRGRPKITDHKIDLWPTDKFIADAKFTNWVKNKLEQDDEAQDKIDF